MPKPLEQHDTTQQTGRWDDGGEVGECFAKIVDGLGKLNGPLEGYLEQFNSVIDKTNDRYETLLHYILIRLCSHRKREAKIAKSPDSPHPMKSADKEESTRLSDKATGYKQMGWVDLVKQLFQQVLCRYPDLLKASSMSSINLFQLMLTITPPCLEVIFWTVDLISLDESQPNDHLTSNIKDVLMQIQPLELFNPLICNYKLDESVKAVEKLALLYRNIRISKSTLSDQLNWSREKVPSLHLAVAALDKSAAAKDGTISSLQSIIKQLLYCDAQDIYIKHDGKTAYDILLNYTGEASDERANVVEMFKFHCISHSKMTRHEKEAYLYPNDQEGTVTYKNPHFELS